MIKVFFRVFFKGQFVTRGGRVIVAGRRGVGCRLGATRARGRSCTKLDRPHRRWMQFARGRCFPRAPQSAVYQETEGCAEGWDASKKRHQYRHAVGSTQVRGQMPTVYCFCKIENHRTTRMFLSRLFPLQISKSRNDSTCFARSIHYIFIGLQIYMCFLLDSILIIYYLSRVKISLLIDIVFFIEIHISIYSHNLNHLCAKQIY